MIEIFRKCKICKEIKYLQDFGNASIKNGKQYYRWKCKKCYNEFKNNKRKKDYEVYKKYKDTLFCNICGYSKKTHKTFTSEALDFHHFITGKKYNIGDKAWGTPLHKLKKEIKKCRILCNRCHSEIHAYKKKNYE
mgnify:CR=1 FL=1